MSENARFLAAYGSARMSLTPEDALALANLVILLSVAILLWP